MYITWIYVSAPLIVLIIYVRIVVRVIMGICQLVTGSGQSGLIGGRQSIHSPSYITSLLARNYYKPKKLTEPLWRRT